MKLSNILYLLSSLWLLLCGFFILPLGFSLYEKDGLHFLYLFQMIGLGGVASFSGF